MKLICPDCGTQYDSGKFCQECGAKLQEVTPELVCPSCGYKAKSGKFCPECGTKLTEQTPVDLASTVPEKQQPTFNERDSRFAKYYDKKGFPRTIPQEERAVAKEELAPYVSQDIAEAKMLLGLTLLEESKKSNERDVFLKSESLIKEAAEAGDKFAYYVMGMLYLIKGEKLDEAEKRLLECYDEFQDEDSAGILAELYAYTETKLDYPKAFEYATIAANDDVASGYQVLGALYLNGWGVEKNPDKAVENYMQAAALGDELSMNQIGYIYLGQDSGEANPDKAFYWFNEASKKGDDMGMYNLGCCYREGFGVEADYETAAEWFKKAADLGNVGAMKDLGQYYQEVLIDGKKAKMWYTKAAEAGDIESKSLLSELYTNEENRKNNDEATEQALLADTVSAIKGEKSNGGSFNEWVVPEDTTILTDLTFKSLPNTSVEWREHIEIIRLPKTFRVEEDELTFLDDTYDYMDNTFYAFPNLKKVIIPTGEIDRFCKLSTWINQNWNKVWNNDGTHVYPAVLPLIEKNEYFTFTPYTETVVSKNYFGNVILSPNCKEISQKAFSFNKGIDTMYMFDSVEIIGKEAFYGCKNLTEVHWSKNAKTIQKNVFNGCKSLKKIVIPEGVTAIEEAAFCDCKALESIILPSTIVRIDKGGTFGFNPFQLCGSLKEIIVPIGTKAKFQQLLNGFSGNPANLLVEGNI